MQQVYENQGLYLRTGISGSKASERVSVDKTLTPLREVPFPRILAYDSQFFPTVREGFLKHFLYQPDCKGYASVDEWINGRVWVYQKVFQRL